MIIGQIMKLIERTILVSIGLVVGIFLGILISMIGLAQAFTALPFWISISLVILVGVFILTLITFYFEK